jgi:large subunit ribosomal protein L10
MKMANSEKIAAVADLKARFEDSASVFLTEYRGLSVADIKTLRRSLGENDSYAVVKNTLAKIAANQAGITSLDEDLKGPSAIAFVKGDPVEAAKALKTFQKTNDSLVLKGGIVDGGYVDSEGLLKLADLESREVLLAAFAGAAKANLTKMAYVMKAPLSKFARTADALKEKKEA